MKFIFPAFKMSSFNCPLCGVYSEQTWTYTVNGHYNYTSASGTRAMSHYKVDDVDIAKCSHCLKFSIWVNEKMIYPLVTSVEIPNEDMPADVKAVYKEAESILQYSPKGAAALLRLALQKLCIHLGEKGKNINDDIANMVNKGLPISIQQALDSIRVVGNNAVHPGTIDFNDNEDIANALFKFINIICDVLISQPKKIAEYYAAYVPENAKKSIEKRDE